MPDPHRYNVEGLPEWPLMIQDAVVDTQHADDEAGVCRLKYDRKPGGDLAGMCSICRQCAV
jgi:hypothetical protein